MRISVDPSALTQAAGRFDAVVTELGSSNLTFADPGAVAQRLINDALDDFCDSWEQRGLQLREEVRNGATYLRSTAEQFQHADQALSGVLEGRAGRGGGGGGGGGW